MFSFFNWFYSSKASASAPVPVPAPVQSAGTSKKTHILSDSEYVCIMTRLNQLEKQINQSPYVNTHISKPEPNNDQKLQFDSIRNELLDKIKLLRLRESLGFGPDEARIMDDIENSVML